MGDSEEKKEEQKNEPQKKASGHPFLKLVFLLGLAGAGYYLFTHYRLEREAGRVVVSWNGEATISSSTPNVQSVSQPTAPATKPYVRLATLNLDPSSGGGFRGEVPVASIAVTLREFDLIAIQGIRSDTQRLLLDLVEKMNEGGETAFAFAADPDVSQGKVRRYNAFVYQSQTIETDSRNLFTVDSPKGGFRYRPLVGHFRVRGPQPNLAFTFCLINVTIPMGYPENNRFPIREAQIGMREMDMMAKVFERAEEAVPKEDDILVVGGLNMHPWYGMQVSGFDKWDPAAMSAALKKRLIIPDLDRIMPFSTARSVAIGNIFLRRKMTVEYTGRSDVQDLFPEGENRKEKGQLVWAEFYSREGTPRVASKSGPHSW